MQAQAKIPDDAWEYQIRKANNDAAYNGLDYVPYCTTMPVRPNPDENTEVKFMWVSCATTDGLSRPQNTLLPDFSPQT